MLNTNVIPPPLGSKPRVDYVDILKGFAILWIIWIHTDHYDFVGTPYRNPIFFFTSGIFFKLKPLKDFALVRLNRLIIPFLFFYLLSYPFRMVVHYWDFRTLADFRFSCILDVFDVCAVLDYLFVNVPLWFLLCLCAIHFIFYGIANLPKWCLLVLAVVVIYFKEFILSVPSPFMINNAVYWMPYFILGYVIGRWFVKNVVSRRQRAIALLICVASFCLVKFGPFATSDYDSMVFHVEVFVFIMMLMSLLSLFDGSPHLEILRFYGKNSLPVLGFHVLILIPLIRVVHRFYPGDQPFFGLIASIIVAAILYPVIRFMNRKYPYFVGKGDLVRSRHGGYAAAGSTPNQK